MRIEHLSPAAFAERVTPFLTTHEAEHGLLLGLIGAGRADPPPRWAYAALARDGDDVAAVAQRTDDRIVLSRASSPTAVAALTHDALTDDRRAAVRFVNGPPSELAAFVEASGSAWRTTMRQGVYAVHRVIPARPTVGAPRLAHLDDVDTLTSWAIAFEHEALGESIDRATIEGRVRARIAARSMHVWESDGRIVASAAAAGPTPHGIRVNFVYTPPTDRGRGFAGALVAALSQRLLDEGREFVLLHTDLANAVANRVYARIGYERVGEMHVVAPS